MLTELEPGLEPGGEAEIELPEGFLDDPSADAAAGDGDGKGADKAETVDLGFDPEELTGTVDSVKSELERMRTHNALLAEELRELRQRPAPAAAARTEDEFADLNDPAKFVAGLKADPAGTLRRFAQQIKSEVLTEQGRTVDAKLGKRDHEADLQQRKAMDSARTIAEFGDELKNDPVFKAAADAIADQRRNELGGYVPGLLYDVVSAAYAKLARQGHQFKKRGGVTNLREHVRNIKPTLGSGSKINPRDVDGVDISQYSSTELAQFRDAAKEMGVKTTDYIKKVQRYQKTGKLTAVA